MSESGSKTYRRWEPERYRYEAQSPAAKLPEGDLVFFLLDTVPQLDLGRFYAPYETETRGAPPFDPAMMVCLLLSAYLSLSRFMVHDAPEARWPPRWLVDRALPCSPARVPGDHHCDRRRGAAPCPLL